MSYLSVRRILLAVSMIIAMVIQITMPFGYAVVRHAGLSDNLDFKARVAAARVSKFIFANAAMWEYQAVRLAEVIEIPGEDQSQVRQSLVSASGRIIVSDHNPLISPVLARQAPVVVNGQQVATLVVEASMAGLVQNTVIIAVLAFFIAAACYMAVRHWPMRLAVRAMAELVRQKAQTENAMGDLERMDVKLRERTRQLLQAQEIGRIGDWSYKPGSGGITGSAVALALLRLSPGEAGMPVRRLFGHIHRGDIKALKTMLVAAAQGGEGSIDLRFARGDGTLADISLTCRVERTEGEATPRFSGTVQDISERKEAERQLEQLAFYDPLTGLANRSLFRRKLGQIVVQARASNRPGALLLIDLDRFKEVNDSLGHAAGDELLVKVAGRLGALLPRGQALARLGGDEFAIILDHHAAAEASALARAVVESVAKAIPVGRSEAMIGASIGVALLPGHGRTADEVIKFADLALYRAKSMGRGCHVVFEQEMDDRFQEKMALARDLRHAALNGGLGLETWLQPQHDLAGNVVGFEALMRWDHPERGWVPPSDFIPIAESSSLICDIGLWILRESARLAKEWIDAGGAPYEIAVNLSPAQIWQTNVQEDVARVLAETGLPPHLLVLELTESLLVDHAEGRVRKTLQALKGLGVKLALDDFGTGYSSLGYLIQLPFDKLKIDRVFVAAAAHSDKARHVLQGIVALGHGLGMTVVAEGVEREEELAILRGFGCDQVQGFLLARPAPAPAAFAYALRKSRECRAEQHRAGEARPPLRLLAG